MFPSDEIRVPSDENIPFNPEETGTAFIENSLIKARSLWQLIKKPVLADDSGICVHALNGRPGIYSSRYAGKNMSQGTADGTKLPQSEQNRLLLEEMAGCTDRRCMYVCAMVFYYGDNRFFSVQETMEGVLVENISQAGGTGGFGYDPIVFIPELKKTVAELTDSEKNLISHRGKACGILIPLIRQFSIMQNQSAD